MSVGKIVEYVMGTPDNTNRAVLISLLEELVREVSDKDLPVPVSTPDEFTAALEKGGKIEVKSSFTIPSTTVISTDVELIIDSSKTITCGANQIKVNGGNLTLSGEGTITGTGRPLAVSRGKLIIDGPTVTSIRDCAVEAYGANSEVIFESGLITAQEVGILGTYASTITVNGGTVQTTDNFCVGGNGTSGQGGTTININGGKLEGHITSAGYVACGVYHPQDGVLNITGGEIQGVGGCGVLMRAGVLNMTGGTVIGSGEPGLKGKVGDSRVVVGPNGIVFDQSAHYPDNQNLEIKANGGMVIGVDTAVEVLKDDGYNAKIDLDGATLIPAPVEDEVVYDGGEVEGN